MERLAREFRNHLLKLSDDLSLEDVKKLVYGLAVPPAKSEAKEQAYEIFHVLEQQGKLSPTKFGILKDVLRAIGRNDLESKVAAKEEYFARLSESVSAEQDLLDRGRIYTSASGNFHEHSVQGLLHTNSNSAEMITFSECDEVVHDGPPPLSLAKVPSSEDYVNDGQSGHGGSVASVNVIQTQTGVDHDLFNSESGHDGVVATSSTSPQDLTSFDEPVTDGMMPLREKLNPWKQTPVLTSLADSEFSPLVSKLSSQGSTKTPCEDEIETSVPKQSEVPNPSVNGPRPSNHDQPSQSINKVHVPSTGDSAHGSQSEHEGSMASINLIQTQTGVEHDPLNSESGHVEAVATPSSSQDFTSFDEPVPHGVIKSEPSESESSSETSNPQQKNTVFTSLVNSELHVSPPVSKLTSHGSTKTPFEDEIETTVAKKPNMQPVFMSSSVDKDTKSDSLTSSEDESEVSEGEEVKEPVLSVPKGKSAANPAPGQSYGSLSHVHKALKYLNPQMPTCQQPSCHPQSSLASHQGLEDSDDKDNMGAMKQKPEPAVPGEHSDAGVAGVAGVVAGVISPVSHVGAEDASLEHPPLFDHRQGEMAASQQPSSKTPQEDESDPDTAYSSHGSITPEDISHAAAPNSTGIPTKVHVQDQEQQLRFQNLVDQLASQGVDPEQIQQLMQFYAHGHQHPSREPVEPLKMAGYAVGVTTAVQNVEMSDEMAVMKMEHGTDFAIQVCNDNEFAAEVDITFSGRYLGLWLLESKETKDITGSSWEPGSLKFYSTSKELEQLDYRNSDIPPHGTIKCEFAPEATAVQVRLTQHGMEYSRVIVRREATIGELKRKVKETHVSCFVKDLDRIFHEEDHTIRFVNEPSSPHTLQSALHLLNEFKVNAVSRIDGILLVCNLIPRFK